MIFFLILGAIVVAISLVFWLGFCWGAIKTLEKIKAKISTAIRAAGMQLTGDKVDLYDALDGAFMLSLMIDASLGSLTEEEASEMAQEYFDEKYEAAN